jgi:hypothetical protein
MAVGRGDKRLWYFNSATHRIEYIPLSTIRAPKITQQPAASTAVGVGGNVYLSVSAMGQAPLSYQWTLGNTNLPGLTNYFLSMNGIQPGQAGAYRVIVNNPYGTVTSAVAQVSVLVPPTVVTPPQGTNVLAGRSFSLSVTAAGSGPLSYRWTFEGNTINGATNSVLTVTDAQTLNEGVYRAIVSNTAGSVSSSPALVRVIPAGPLVISPPASVTAPASTNVSFVVSAIGSEPLFYQWLLNGVPIPGANGTHYSIENVQSWNAGTYQVVVTNGSGTVTSPAAVLTVTPVIPYFVLQPVGASLPAGTNLTLSGLARGSEPITYQWRRANADLPGAVQTSLTLSNVQPSDSGGYTLVAFNGVGPFTSAVANVVVTGAPPVFVQHPASVAALAGSSTTLNSLATGSSPLHYQWYFQNNPLGGQTNRLLVLNPVTLASAGPYQVIASNTFGRATSDVAQVSVNQAPLLQQALTNQVVDVNSTVSLTASATGSGTLAYSWQFNGVALPTTGQTLVLSNIQPSQSGYYRVTIANPFGSISSTGRVSVLGPASWVVSWGDDSGGQTEVPASLDNVVAVAGGDFHSLALKRDGVLVGWGYGGYGQVSPPASPLRFVAAAAGAMHSLAITEDGYVVAWGLNDSGQCNVPGTAASVLAVAAGDSHSVALLSSGTVVGWGDNTFGQANGGANLTDIRAIAAGRIHNLALRKNGTVAGWGFNGYGQATQPQGLSGVEAIAAGYLHSVALLSNRTVVAWGDSTYGQTNVPAGLSNVVAIAAGDFHTFALRTDGSVVVWGDNSYGQADLPPNLGKPIGIASGYYHGLALLPPALQARRTQAGMVIEWCGPGVLQWAPSPAGPFTDMPGVERCYTNSSPAAPSKYFRLRRW